MSTLEKKHDYHLVDPSPLPIFTSFSMLVMAIGAVLFMHGKLAGHFVLPLGLILVFSCLFSWWRDVIKEGREQKAHTKLVTKGLSIGMMLFIVSEVMFFVAFFWAFFHARLFPHEMSPSDIWDVKASIWPPKGIETFNPWNLPFMNTLILLLSGTTLTWAHYEINHNNRAEAVRALGITIILGVTFTLLQAYEYHHASFNITQGIYPANFFLATGFHGLHVIIGTIFLFVSYLRAKKGHYDAGNNMLGFEFAAWYWHFVDAVWIFLFIFVYILGS
jgi:cytochrome c oxidase subunit III